MGNEHPPKLRAWMYAYMDRIERRLEHCRHCRARDDLRLDRIKPRGEWTMENVTVLCAAHAQERYLEYQPDPAQWLIVEWRHKLTPLYREELAAPPDCRWGLIALDKVRRKDYSLGSR
jgi:hypothetical protein